MTDYSIEFTQSPLFGWWSYVITTPDGRRLGPIATVGFARKESAEKAAMRHISYDSSRETVSGEQLRARINERETNA